jgi:hypothetical protein
MSAEAVEPLKPESLRAKRLRVERAKRGMTAATRVPTGAAIAHIADLRRCGMSRLSIATASGVSFSVIGALIWGGPAEQRKFILSTTETAILATKFTTDGLGDDALVLAIGAIRRIRGLCWLGFSMSHIARELGMSPQDIHHLTERKWISVKNHRRIAGVYHRRNGSPGPSNYARSIAKKRGWEPPSAWDDDIDDPDVLPVGVTETGGETWQQRVVILSRRGFSDEEISRQLRVKVTSVARILAGNELRAVKGGTS